MWLAKIKGDRYMYQQNYLQSKSTQKSRMLALAPSAKSEGPTQYEVKQGRELRRWKENKITENACEPTNNSGHIYDTVYKLSRLLSSAVVTRIP